MRREVGKLKERCIRELLYFDHNFTDSQELLKANEEFVEEVKKLYLEEEQWKMEKQCLLEKRKRLEDEYEKDTDDLAESIMKERSANEEQLKQLNHSLEILNLDNNTLNEDITRKIESSLKTEDVSTIVM